MALSVVNDITTTDLPPHLRLFGKCNARCVCNFPIFKDVKVTVDVDTASKGTVDVKNTNAASKYCA
jgi:hypothetical protein